MKESLGAHHRGCMGVFKEGIGEEEEEAIEVRMWLGCWCRLGLHVHP